MKVIYVAGPYRGDVAANICRAWSAALALWDAGYVALCPHLNTAWFDEARPDVPDTRWLAGDLELLRRCDGVALIDGWAHSRGVLAEMVEARRYVGIPVRLLEEWISDGQTRAGAQADEPADPPRRGEPAHQPQGATAAHL